MFGAVALAILAAADAVPVRGQATRAATNVSGIVLTADSPARPVPRAVVTFTPVDAGASAGGWWERAIGDVPATLTDDEGRFQVSGLRVGRYRVRAAKPAFLATEFGAMRPGEPGTAVAITDGADVRDITITLVRGAVITGVVRAPDGRSAANLGVVATLAGPRGARYTATTDDRGEYRFFGLPAGGYLVSSWLIGSFSPGESSTSVSVSDVDAALAALERRFPAGRAVGGIGIGAPGASAPPRPAGSAVLPPFRPLQAAPTFFPGTIDQAGAIPVTVAAGETRDNVDFQLVVAGTVEVTGVVRLPDGRPASGAMLSVAVGRGTSTAADGSFRIGGLSPGRQTLNTRLTAFSVALAEGRPLDSVLLQRTSSAGATWWAMDEIDVPASGLSNLSVTLWPGMTLSGRVTFDATSLTAPTDFGAVQIRLTVPGVTAPPVIRGDGSFDLRGIAPGPLQIAGIVAGASSPGWWLRSAVLNGQDLLDLPLEFTADTGDLGGVVLVFSDRHTEVAGVLETPAGLPATSYMVAVLPSDRRLWHPLSRRLAFTRPATDGRFSFPDLPPGEYVIVALTDLDALTWRHAGFLESLVGAGVPVTLVEGGRTVQNLRIAR